MKIVRVSAIWCMSCLVMRNRYDKLFKEFEINEVKDLDYDEDSEEVEELNIGDILPVVIVYQDDKEIKRIIGEKTKKELKEIFTTLNEKT
ncbi:MAG: thioredoxin family protein [Candidatus Izimaplasma sp.]|nr:thioredoxin family protein [Candidatus Izimaplasma bacterium]